MKLKIAALVVLCLFSLAISTSAQKSKIKADNEIAEQFTDAAKNGYLDKVQSMLASGVNIDIESSSHKGWTALMAASTYGETAAVKYLISKGANVKVKLENGETALIQSAQNNENKEIVEALLKADVEINAQTRKGLTALMRFAWMSQSDAVKLLLDAGADTNLKTKAVGRRFILPAHTETVKKSLAI